MNRLTTYVGCWHHRRRPCRLCNTAGPQHLYIHWTCEKELGQGLGQRLLFIVYKECFSSLSLCVAYNILLLSVTKKLNNEKKALSDSCLQRKIVHYYYYVILLLFIVIILNSLSNVVSKS